MRSSWRLRACCVGGSLFILTSLTAAGSAAADPWDDPKGPGNWSGVYIGAHGGYGFGDIDYTVDVPGVVNEKITHDPSGWVYGGHLGVQHQYGRIVAGLEVSYSELDLSETKASISGGGRVRDIDIDSLFTATGRLGLASDHMLAYVKGGYAAADVGAFISSNGSPKLGASDWEGGWTLGAGIEFNCLSRFIVGLEYDYVSLDIDDRKGDFPPPDTKGFTHTDFGSDIHTVLARISYKFGHDPAPAPLK